MYSNKGKLIRRDEDSYEDINVDPIAEDGELEKRDLFEDLEQNYDFEYEDFPEV